MARFADIDTRREMGFSPRKLPPSDLVIKMGIRRPLPHLEYTLLVFTPGEVWVEVTLKGHIWWHFRERTYWYSRP